MVNVGLAFDIAAPITFLILVLIGVAKAWPYRKTDRNRFVATYKPYKWWGLILCIALNVIGVIFILLA